MKRQKINLSEVHIHSLRVTVPKLKHKAKLKDKVMTRKPQMAKAKQTQW